MIRVLLPFVVAASAVPSRAQAVESRELPAAGLKALKASTESGDVAVTARAGETVSVEIVGAEAGLCAVTVEAKGGVATLKAKSLKRWIVEGEGCEAGLRVRAPAGLALEASSGSGSVRVEGWTGTADLSTGSGTIEGSTGGSLVKARTGSGSVRLTGLAGSADVKTGSGRVSLAWAKAPAAGTIKASTGSGSVELTLPRGTRADTRFSTGSGDVSNALGDAEGAPLTVSASTGSGDVRASFAD